MDKARMACFGLMLMASTVAAAGQPGLKVGDQAPDFEAVNHKGQTIRLSDHYSNGPVILIFYRGGWCPYCNLHLRSFQEHIEDFREYSAEIVAVSVDTVDEAAKTVKDENIGFEVVSNPGTEILKNYGLVFKVPDDLVEKYKNEYGIDLEASSGMEHHIIAIPATYVIDRSGRIVFAYANEDYKVRAKPQDVKQFLSHWSDTTTGDGPTN